jgi:hypothetical protein
MVHGAANLQRNPPECDKSSEDCGCDNGAEVGRWVLSKPEASVAVTPAAERVKAVELNAEKLDSRNVEPAFRTRARAREIWYNMNL